MALDVPADRARTALARRLVTLLTVFACLASVAPALAAELPPEPEDEQADADIGRITTSERRWQLPSGASPRGMWPWLEGGRSFLRTPDGLVSADLANGAELGRVSLDPPPWESQGLSSFYDFATRGEHTIALDPVNGRLYVPYGIPTLDYTGWWPLGLVVMGLTWALDPARPGEFATARASDAAEGTVCVSFSNFANGGQCVAGMHVLDATTLEVVGRIPLTNVRAETPGFGSILRAVVWSPPVGDESGAGKVHMLVEEIAHQVDVFTAFSHTQSRQFGQFSVNYLIQFDAASGAQEWVTRIEACRGTRDDPSDPGPGSDTMHHQYPGAIMRSTDPGDRAVYVGCNTSSSRVGVVVRVPLDERGFPHTVPVTADDPVTRFDDFRQADDPRSQMRPPIAVASRQQAFPGPEYVLEFRADPLSRRFMLHANRDGTSVWWVFDPRERAYVGGIGIGGNNKKTGWAAFDPVSGRLYVHPSPAWNDPAPSRLFIADIRRTPLPQALVYEIPQQFDQVSVASRDGHLPIRIWGRQGGWVQELLDARPLQQDPELRIEGNTLDVPERPGVTAVSFDGAVRGYGARLIAIGGLQGMARLGPFDPLTTPHSLYNRWAYKNTAAPKDTLPPWNTCLEPDRELVLAFVGPDDSASLNTNGGRGAVQPVFVDQRTRNDGASPVDRCGAMSWEQVWTSALFGRAPVTAPAGVPEDLWNTNLSCVAGDEAASEWEDPYLGVLAGRATCGEEEISGFAQARGLDNEVISISEALSSFRIYRDPGRGLVARIESVTRGVDLEGVVRIDTVRGVAESWANGRRQPVPAEQREQGYDPNCDLERSAGTCFRRHLFGVWTPAYSCGPCGDEQAAVDGIGRALGADASVRLRQPDPALARGAENGYNAGIQKPDTERYADMMMNNDLLQTTVPTLEIIRYAGPTYYGLTQAGDPATFPVRGRQIIQLAGVEASTSYAIECMATYDPATNICAERVEQPGSLVIELTNAAGEPLAGGAFSVHADGDGDGVLGLADELVPEGACVTGDDGVGTCRFETLPAGGYLVTQTATPPGHAAVADPYAVTLAEGEQHTVTFANASNLATIAIEAKDGAGRPVSGAAFAAYRDPDGDGQVAEGAEPAGTCQTDAAGACAIAVPTGSYVLVQTGAPPGLAPMAPVAFALSAGGQVAAVGVVNEAVASPAGPAPAPAPDVRYEPPPVTSPPVSTVEPAPEAPPREPVSAGADLGGTIEQVIRAPRDALALLSREPLQALAWTGTIILLTLALGAARRRRRVLGLLA